jgi:shikimate kinase/3-dehydroquinate synthase
MRSVYLIGFMAAGKTTAGRLLADRLGMPFVDVDDVVAGAAGMPVPDLFRAHGEPEFRRREAAALALLAAGPPSVIATGGGAPAHEDNLARMRAGGLVVALAVSLDVALARAGDPATRPLLARPPAEIAALFHARQPFYRQAHAVVSTDGRTPAEVADRAAAAVRAADPLADDVLPDAAVVALGERSYPIAVASGAARDLLGPLTRELLPRAQRVALVTDSNVGALYGDAVAAALTAAGLDVVRAEVTPGETSKTLDAFGALCDFLVAAGLDRSSTIVALGGGVVGDLAGFTAATLYRGIPCIQVPTTLLAMVDSAIGGKTGVDLDAGKNLVGAIWQPRLVLIDPDLLPSLPRREQSAAFGELVKYALLDGDDLYRDVEAIAAAPCTPTDTQRRVIRRCAAYKAWTVGLDEREEAHGVIPHDPVSGSGGDRWGGERGDRALLNLGHTIGHAIESASMATTAPLLHGEAVALGLLASCRVSAALGLADPALETTVAGTLARAGLDTALDPWLRPDVIARAGVDKKRTGSRIRFIALERPGAPHAVSLELERLGEILAAPKRL